MPHSSPVHWQAEPYQARMCSIASIPSCWRTIQARTPSKSIDESLR
jgi:hypothetical protein